jgi:flavin-dependent dehydrogenase
MRELVDVVIAGGGPAGLAAAIEAGRNGMSVVVVDPHDGKIDKACGEGIMPGGVEALSTLGVEPEGIPFVGVRYAHASDPNLRALGRFPEGAGLGVRRTVLQAAMRERAVECGARFVVEPVKTFVPEGDGVLVNERLFGRWLVAADGLRSPVRAALGLGLPSRSPDRERLGLRRHYAVRPWSDRVEVYFGEHAEAYVTPVSSELVGVALLFEGGASGETATRRFDRLLADFPLLRHHLAGRVAVSKVRGAGPFEQRVARRVSGNVVLVGDAAGYVDPLTGEGIALGIATAQAAVSCLLQGRPEAYEAKWHQLTRRPFVLTSVLLSIARRARLHAPLLRFVCSWPAVFDAALGMMSRASITLPRTAAI